MREHIIIFFFFQAEDGIRDRNVTGVQTCALPISRVSVSRRNHARPGESGTTCTCKATERLSTRSHAWYTVRSGVTATRWSRRNAGASARTTSSNRSGGGIGGVIAPNLTASTQPVLHQGTVHDELKASIALAA